MYLLQSCGKNDIIIISNFKNDFEGFMTGLEMAKNRLRSGGYTCVIIREGDELASRERGVAPLVAICTERGFDSLAGASAADRVVGRATAFLYLLLGVCEIYAEVISAPALELLKRQGVKAEYGRCVPNIINRQGDGICPFEAAVLEITGKRSAYLAILEKMRKMHI